MLEELKKYKVEMENDYKYLHENAEPGFDMEKTFRYVEKKLQQLGYKPVKCGRAGIVAEVGTGHAFVLRADMDALPMMEETKLPYAATGGCMHACGHDMHTASLLGAAKYLKNHESELKGKIRLVFQPAEELLAGAKDMIEAGVLKDGEEKVLGAMMIHVIAASDLPIGTAIVSSPGVSAPAADYFTIKVIGRGCHGSTPDNGIDPINIAAHVIINLQEIHARELSLEEDAVLTIGTLETGKGANIIQNEVVIKGTLRAYDEEVRAFIKKRIMEIAERTASVFRGAAEVTYDSGCPSLYNDEKLSLIAKESLEKLLGTDKVFTTEGRRGGGSEDFAYISREVPSIMIAVPAGNKNEGYDYPIHHPKVTFDTEALVIGSGIYAQMALEFFGML